MGSRSPTARVITPLVKSADRQMSVRSRLGTPPHPHLRHTDVTLADNSDTMTYGVLVT